MSDNYQAVYDAVRSRMGGCDVGAAVREALDLQLQGVSYAVEAIKYMLGNESWLPAHERGLIRLHCEEWGNLGPMEMNPEIKPNKAGFRVRCTSIIAPPGAHGFTEIEGVYYWTDMDFLMDKPGLSSVAKHKGATNV